MKTYTVVAAIALTAILFANPVMASNSIESSNERGYSDNGVRGYHGEAMVPEPDVEESIGQSRENGGLQRALNNPKSGYGPGIDSREQSRENGMRW